MRGRKPCLRLGCEGSEATNLVAPHSESNRMNKILVTVATGVLAVAAFSANASSDKALAAQAKVQMPQARSLALKAYPGKIVKEELENEKGGSGLRYSFVIKSGAVSHEVGIDAKTGKLLENSVEGADND